MPMNGSSMLNGLQAPASVLRIVDVLEKAGYETWAVGGAVRDRMLGLEAGDWDLATSARPKDIQRLFRRTVPLGIEHGTVGVLDRDNHLIEVTTFRKDVLPLGRKAIVEFADSIEEDLSRRDFTINAVAWHPRRLTSQDPFDGIADIAQRTLRCVGVSNERFREDHLRILRGLRFAGRFKLEIHPNTWRAMVDECHHVRELSSERIREELLKVLEKDDRPSRSLGLYRATGVWAALLPEHESALSEVGGWGRALAICDRLSLRDPIRRLVPVLRPLVEWGGLDAVATVLKRLRFSNAEIDRLIHLCQLGQLGLPGDRAVESRRWLHHAGPEWRSAVAIQLAASRFDSDGAGSAATDTLRSVKTIRTQAQAGVPLQLADLAVDGKDLTAAGMTPGPQFGEILSHLLERVLEDPGQNRPDVLMDLALGWAAETNEARSQDRREPTEGGAS